MKPSSTAILHYTAPPVVGGVEAVIQAHAQIFVDRGIPTTVVAGWGSAAALAGGAEFVRVTEMDSQYRPIAAISKELVQGHVPPSFDPMVSRLTQALSPLLSSHDNVVVHNILTKHFNLPLTVALFRLLDAGTLRNCIAWSHDFTWTSPSSRSKVHPGYPWDLLRTLRDDITYVTVSRRRQQELAGLLKCLPERIHVVYNGVDPGELLGLSPEGQDLVQRLDLLAADLILLMPVRVTQAKNIEYALHVLAGLKALGKRPKLVLTGPPDPHDSQSMAYFESLQALRAELDVQDAMHFVFESGPDDEPLTIASGVVGDLYRISDLMFMPSHREGFAMPVLEAGMVGIPVVCTRVPAATELGSEDVMLFDAQEDPAHLAERIVHRLDGSQLHRLRRRVRQQYTWQAIFQHDIEPLLA
jgi:glycosyltransferase involved in cell wall biosynthesis